MSELQAWIKFITKKCENIDSPFSVRSLCQEFLEETGSTTRLYAFEHRVRKYREVIHKIGIFSDIEKVEQLFGLSVPVDSNFLKLLREKATVTVDESNRIIDYSANDGSFELKGKSYKYARNRKSEIESDVLIDEKSTNDYEAEKSNLVNFITEKCENIVSPLNIYELCKEFKQKTRSTTSIRVLSSRISKYREKIHRSDILDENEKVKQIFGLRASVDSKFLEKLRKNAHVNVDDHNRITEYTSNHMKLKKEQTYNKNSKNTDVWKNILQKVNSKNKDNDVIIDDDANKIYETEMTNLINFFIEKCENANSPLYICQMCREFKEKTGMKTNLRTLTSRLERYRERIPTIENIDPISKVKQLFALGYSVDGKLLNELRKTAKVNLDDKRRIIEYKSNDGSLNLQGDHGIFLTPYRKVKREVDDDSNFSRRFENTIVKREYEPMSLKHEELPLEPDTISRKNHRYANKRSHENDIGNIAKRAFDASRVKNEPVEDVEPMDIDPVTREGAEEPENVEKKPTNLLSSISATLKDSRELDSPYESDTKGDISRKGVEPDLESLVIENMEKKPTILLNLRDEDVEPMDIESVEREDVAVDKTAALERVDKEKQPLQPVSVNEDTFSVQNGLSGVASPLESVPEKRGSIMDKEKLVPVSDHINFLESIKNVITTLDIPNLKMLESRIENKIQKMKESGNKEEEVTLMELRASISTCLLIIQKNSIKELSNGETTTSVKEFLLILRTSLIRINIPILDQSQHQIKKWIQRISDQVSTISIDKLRSSLQSLLDLVAP